MDINRICTKCMKEVKGTGTICPTCNRDITAPFPQGHCLRPYSILNGKYLVGDVIGQGGFGITYIALDLNLEAKIAIKEFYPNGYVTRDNTTTTTVTMYSGNEMAAVQKWRDGFVKEAQSLAKCSSFPGIVGVRDFFNENDTAYIVMEYVEGETIENYVKRRGGTLPPVELFRLIEPVMTSLQKVHETGVIHRDISPDNIMIQKNGEMKLLDFGAARSFGEDSEKSKFILLKHGYAPEEQYRTRGNQGPWSDVYAFAATLYKCLTGKTPVESTERPRSDSLKSPMECGANISPATNAVIMKALAVYEENRYRSMRDFHNALYATLPDINVSSIQSDGNGYVPETKSQTDYEMQNMEHQDEDTDSSDSKNLFDLIKKNPVYGVILVLVVVFIVMLGFMVGKGKPNKKHEKSNATTQERPDSPYYYQNTAGDYVYAIVPVQSGFTYANAKKEVGSIKESGHLLTIDSEEEMTDLKRAFAEANSEFDLKNTLFWVGGDQVTTQREDEASNRLLYYNAKDSELYWLDLDNYNPLSDEKVRIGYIYEFDY